MPSFRTGLLIAIVLAVPAIAGAQTTIHVTSEAGLRTALINAQNGDAIVFDNAITLTGDLPTVQRNVTIDGGGFSLSGNNQYRGLFVAAFAPGTATPQGVSVTIQNLTIQNTRAAGGDGGAGTLGGGGGAGLGGALFVANQASVTINNVSFVSNAAAGGSGGAGGAGLSGGGGGGLGGNGGLGDGGSGGGGGGVGRGATGGRTNAPAGGAGILTSAAAGGSSNAFAGGAQGGGGAFGGSVGAATPIPEGGAGGGAGGASPAANIGGAGGFGGGGGGATASAGSVSASGGFGGGGGGGTGGAGGFGGGGGGAAGGNAGGFGGGTGSGGANPGGGGGAGLGGAIFVQDGGSLSVAGGLNVNGNSVAGGSGVLGGTNGSAVGGGLFLQGNGTLNFTPGGGQTQTIADAIADQGGNGGPGSWALSKSGTGTLVLSGANSFTGGVTVNDGTLSVGSDGNLGGGALTLNNASTLAIGSSGLFGRQARISGAPTFSIGAGQSVTWSGQLTNAATPGALQVSGGGTLSLTNAANSYSGGTFVRGGSALVVNADGVLGAPSGGLTLGDATTTGTLRIVDGSVFSSNRVVVLGGDAVIDTAGSSSATFGVGLNGKGGLTKNGTGTLTLNGAQSFAGPTSVVQGTFALNGSLPGSVVVYPAGTFRGAGTVGGSLTVTGAAVTSSTLGASARGTIVPLATVVAPSSLVVRGDLVATNGATLGLTLTSPGLTSMVVEGHGIVSGANIDLQVNDPNVTLARVTNYTAIAAAQGLSVVNTIITSNIGVLFPGLQPFISIDKTTLGVTLVDSKAPLATAATTPNALAAGAAIDRVRPTAAGDLGVVVSELTVLADPKLDDALKSIAGEVHGSKVRLVALDAETFTDGVRDEIGSRQRGTEEDRAANLPPPGDRPLWWGQLEGQHAVFKTKHGVDGADGNIGGATFGIDWNFAGRWFAGGGGGYSKGTLTLDALDASSRITAPRAFGYAGVSAGPWSLNFGGSAAWTSYDTSRHLAFAASLLSEPIPGGVDRIAESSQQGMADDVWTEVADSVKIGTWTYDAKIGWRHARYGSDPLKETGAQSLSLEAAAQAIHSSQADVRLNAFRRTGGIRPHFSIRYRRELGDDSTTTDVQFADKPDSEFAVEGLTFGENTTTGLGGVTVHTASDIEYTIDYEIRHAASQTAQSVHFRLRYK